MRRLFIVVLGLAITSACSKPQAPTAQPSAPSPVAATATNPPVSKPAKEVPWLQVPLGLDNENLNIPADNPLTPEKVELGKLLYFDPRLSGDGTISCASCHAPEKGWTDNQPVSDGVRGQKGTRSAPTVINSTYNPLQFWDGRAASLEEQALGPIINPIEMGRPAHDVMVRDLTGIPGYHPYFKKAFGDETITEKRIAQAIASFERTVLGGNSRYDRYAFGDQTAMNESEVRGMNLFFGKANCTRCHVGPNFSDGMFHNLGVALDKPNPDLGRYTQTKAKEDWGAFRTVTVRDITKTAPYMHDGSEKTLEEVVEFYDRGGNKNKNLDVRMQPLNLTAQEKTDLVNFMKALDSNPYPMVEKPTLPQ